MSELYEIFAKCCREIKQNDMEKKFKCKDEVLFRFKDDKKDKWTYGVVSHETGNFIILCGDTALLKENYDVIPYSGNEHLVGTTDEPEEEIVLEKGEKVMLRTSHGNWCFGYYQNHSDTEGILVMLSNRETFWSRSVVPFSKFNPDDMSATKKEILTVAAGRLVKANLK